MASVSKDGRFQWFDATGKRQTVRVAAMVKNKADLETFRTRVQQLQDAKTSGGAWGTALSLWVASLSDNVHEKLHAAGLVPRRAAALEPVEPAAITLGQLRDRFEKTNSVKPGTVAAYNQGLDALCEFFTRARDIRTITNEDADAWRSAVVAGKLSVNDKTPAPATVSKRVQTARLLFRKAIRWKLITDNPFADMKAGKQHNPARQCYIDEATIEKVIAACPDPEWRLIVALSRYAGLRCPSEHHRLTWGDVNFDEGRMLVHAAKTDSVRAVPIDARLLPHLEAALEAAQEKTNAAPVITEHRGRNCNLRTHLLRIMGRAKVPAWPRLFHNLRASCETDWTDRYPLADVAGWIGHDPTVAARHYLTKRSSNFEAAATGRRSVANLSQQDAETPGTDEQAPAQNGNNAGLALAVAQGMGAGGTAQSQDSRGNMGGSGGAVAPSVAVTIESETIAWLQGRRPGSGRTRA